MQLVAWLMCIIFGVIIWWPSTNHKVEAIEAFNNAVQDEPEVECGHGTIGIRVKTSTKKPSYIFAKGHFWKEGCIFKNTDSATFQFEQCNINRKREVNPRGMAYSLTVIVQLHPLFITKIDRAYNVRCFYMEENREVDAALHVSDLTTSMLESGHAMPQCSYSLHRDSPNGPILKYARVGDVVYHVWDCPSDVYAMLVHSCAILDGQGGEHKVIDSNGCSIDDFILPQLTYSNELTRSFTAASVVNLPDRESIYFSCQVKLCFKKGDFCTNVTPPRCGDDSKFSNELPHIEKDLRDDQLLQTAARLQATSKPIRVIQTEATIAANGAIETPVIIVNFTSLNQNDTFEATATTASTTTTRTEAVTKASTQPVTTKLATTKLASSDIPSSLGIVSKSIPQSIDFPLPPTINPVGQQQNLSSKVLIDELEGSGEDRSSGSPISSTISISSDLSVTRGRRTVTEDNYNIVNVDVSTSQLKILEEGFDIPELSPEFGSLSSAPGPDGVCIPMYSIWMLSGVSVISMSIAVAALIYTRLSKNKMASFYRY